jgi:pyrimidine operon attenuation protein / uracil phosphoribosyltransferase
MPQSPVGQPRVAFNSQQIAQGIDSLALAILSRHPDPRGLGLVGVHSGGDLLVRRVEAALGRLAGLTGLVLDKGLVDMSFYRDDWSRLTQMPSLRNTDIPFAVEARDLVLVDDVIFTGRTVRASLDAIFSLGRPARVELAVLVDRGHREFPIEPDYVGLTLPTQRHQSVNVFLFDDHLQDHVTLEDHKYQTSSPASAVA